MKAVQFTSCLVLVTLSTCYNVSDLISDYSDPSDMTDSDYNLIMGPEDNMTELTGEDIEEEKEETEEDPAPIDTGRRKGEEQDLHRSWKYDEPSRAFGNLATSLTHDVRSLVGMCQVSHIIVI